MWCHDTNVCIASQSSTAYTNPLVDLDEKAAVQLGIDNLTFQYFHLVVYLTKADKQSHNTCLAAARSAISMLDRLVSDSNQVFNGIVW